MRTVHPLLSSQGRRIGLTWMDKERGTPVEEKVAASLRAMMPLFPIPVKMSLPIHPDHFYHRLVVVGIVLC